MEGREKQEDYRDQVNRHYILVIKDGLGRGEDEIICLEAPSLVSALRGAIETIKIKQTEKIGEFPFSPPIVKGTLFREVTELNGGDLIGVKKY